MKRAIIFAGLAMFAGSAWADPNTDFLLNELRIARERLNAIQEEAVVIPHCGSKFLKGFPATWPCFDKEKQGIVERGKKEEPKETTEEKK